ncbi:hypothetical protein BCR42DRAFT_495091 [Absidia repens]|uniref:P-loop containing nucleoside triphosphate hydrolase protein n=1 Tax=Absidia repens TaxID=90262 RepID=A0A1X2I4U5_9FUNG|nr:hypothetical protein BCR42DRAFT_495091 [Absidia repens]
MSSWWSFSTLKKEQSSPTPTNHVSPTQPFKTMSNAFRKGVQYNMKIVIRGDVMTGKTTLFDRLQGSKFEEESYSSTPQIQVANIPWQYKDSNDIVKIEVWDVVDKAHNNNNKKMDHGIKLQHTATGPTDPPAAEQVHEQKSSSADMDMALDASTVDVYRNAHAALFIFDTTKQWTFDYVNNALDSVPDNLAVLVLGNFMDKERVVSVEEIHATLYEHNKRRIENGTIKPNLIRYVEISLKTGLGLKFIYDYLGVPFLQLMMETLRKQLELKATDVLDLLETLDNSEDVPEYMQRRRGQDNFDQPAEPHLAKQHEAMKMAWNDELEEITAYSGPPENEFLMDQSPSTLSPPTAPVKVQKRQGSLDAMHIPSPIVDQFETGSLEDDWFQDDTEPAIQPSLNLKNSNGENDDNDEDDGENDLPGNPMVARDEDVAAVEYYQEPHEAESATTSPEGTQTASHQRRASHEPTVMKISDDVSNYYDDDDDPEDSKAMNYRHHMYQTPTFKSELNDIWATHGTNGGINIIQSDSEDEDNIIRHVPDSPPSPYHSPTSSDLRQHVDSPSFSDFAMGGYEEIGGASHDNPWYQPMHNKLEEHGESRNKPTDMIYQEPQRSLSDHLNTTSMNGEKTNATPSTEKKPKKKKKSKSTKNKEKAVKT